MGWVTEAAPTKAELAACNQCGLCLPACPTFRLTGRETASPRGRLMAMSAVADGVMEVDETFADIMGLCLQCRACEVVCPSLVPFGRAMEGARAEVTAQLPSRSRQLRHVGVGRVLASPMLLRIATGGVKVGQLVGIHRILRGNLRQAFLGIRPIRPTKAASAVRGAAERGAAERGAAERGAAERGAAERGAAERGATYPAIGPRVGRVGFLAGCVMDVWFSDVHRAAISLLQHAGYDVVVPAAQTCCGALAAHDGDVADARRLAITNVDAFHSVDRIVVDAAGCGAHMKDYRHWAGTEGESFAGRVVDINEIVSESLVDGRLPHSSTIRERVAVQDPCHLRHAQRIVEPPRDILRAAGHEPVEIDPAGNCCGAAGIYSLLQPEMSRQLGEAKAHQVRQSGAKIVASANPGCEMQLRGFLGQGYEVRHPVELLWEAICDERRLG